MKRTILARIALFVVVVAPLVLAGCGTSPPSKYYVLNAVKAQETAGQVTTAPQSAFIAVGPVQIPDYLDRPQIVTRTARNELAINEFERWGGSLKEDVDRVLVENLTALLASDGVAVVSWKRRLPGAHRLSVEVNHFDAVLGGSVLLKATWALSSPEGTKGLLVRGSTVSQPLNEKDYSAVVAAMSQTLGALSQEIAAGIKSLLAAGKLKTPPGSPAGSVK
jgi:uncharacterized lipoprotein YmbA